MLQNCYKSLKFGYNYYENTTALAQWRWIQARKPKIAEGKVCSCDEASTYKLVEV